MKFKHISKNQVFKNDVITVFEETLALPNDNVVTWTFTGKKEVVAIIAELENEIFFVKQYRPAIKKELIEIPAGLVEKGEDILDAAKREFEEEIGYRANKWEKICTYYNSAGINAAGRLMSFTKNCIRLFATAFVVNDNHLYNNKASR